MSLDGKITFIGAGNMAAAIITGLLRSGTTTPERITAVDLSSAQLEKLSAAHGIGTTTDAAEGVQGAAIVVLAVKPQVMGSVLPVLKSNASAETLFVSIAAGVSCATIEAGLATGARVVRTMPNTPALVGCGATALCAGSHATAADLETAEALFSSVGIAVTVPEKSIDAVTGVSGSGPAYVFLFLEALADGGVQQGLPRDVALKLAGQTVLGAAKLMMESGTHPGVLKDQVTSPGGTTIAAVRALEDGAFRGTTMSAVAAACARSKELSKA